MGSYPPLPASAEELLSSPSKGKARALEPEGEGASPDGVWFALLAQQRGSREGMEESQAKPSSPGAQQEEPKAKSKGGRKTTRKTRHSDSTTKDILPDLPTPVHRVRTTVSSPQLQQKLANDNGSSEANYSAYEGLLQQMGMVGGGQQRGGGGGNHQSAGNGGAAAPSYPSGNYGGQANNGRFVHPSADLQMNSSSIYRRRSSRETGGSQDSGNSGASGSGSGSGNETSQMGMAMAFSDDYPARGSRRHPGLASAPGGQRNMTLKPQNEPASAGAQSQSFAEQQAQMFQRSRAATMTSGMPLGSGGYSSAPSAIYGAVALSGNSTAASSASDLNDPFGSPNTSTVSRVRSLANFHALHAAQQVSRLGEKQDFVLPAHQFRDDVNNQRAAGAVRAALLYGMEQGTGTPETRRKSITADPGGIEQIERELITPNTPTHALPSAFKARSGSISSVGSGGRYAPYPQYQQHQQHQNNPTPPHSAERHGGPIPHHPQDQEMRHVQSNTSGNGGLMLNVTADGRPQQLQQAYYPYGHPSSNFTEFTAPGANEAWGRMPAAGSTSSSSQLQEAYEFPSMIRPRSQTFGSQAPSAPAYYPYPHPQAAGMQGGSRPQESEEQNRANRALSISPRVYSAAQSQPQPQKMRSSPELRTGSNLAEGRPIAARGRATSNASKGSAKGKAPMKGRNSMTPPTPERISSLKKRKSDAMMASPTQGQVPSVPAFPNQVQGQQLNISSASLYSSPSINVHPSAGSESNSSALASGIVAGGNSGSNPSRSATTSTSNLNTASPINRNLKSPKPSGINASSGAGHQRNPSTPGNGATFEFFNFGVEDADELCAAVTPSGSYKVPLANRDSIIGKSKGGKSVKSRRKKSSDSDEDESEEEMELGMEGNGEDEDEDTPTPKNRRAAKKRKSASNLNATGSVGRRGKISK